VTGSGLKQRKEFERMMLDASRHEFDLLLFWKLDRVSREGISTTLRYLESLKGWGVGWRSYQEPWLDTGNEMVTGIVLSVNERVAGGESVRSVARSLNVSHSLLLKGLQD
jgi:DNA invertase Pin-like site-specific DNA recombinase